MMILLLAALAATTTSCVVPPSEMALQDQLAYEEFDSRGGPYGWRYLLAAECGDATLSLLAAYANANDARLTNEQRLELAFHSGQTLAFAGRESEAIPYFERATNAQAMPEWQIYVAATLAFLRRDAAALAAARLAYAKVAPDSMRLRIVDGFIACPHESYSKAAHCGM